MLSQIVSDLPRTSVAILASAVTINLKSLPKLLHSFQNGKLVNTKFECTVILKNHSAGNISWLFLGEVNVPGLFPQSKMRFRGYFHCSGETFYGQLSLMLRSAKVTASDLLTTIIQDQHMSGASQHMFGLLKYKEMPLQGQEATSTKRQKIDP